VWKISPTQGVIKMNYNMPFDKELLFSILGLIALFVIVKLGYVG
jgi:hypothetical protein